MEVFDFWLRGLGHVICPCLLEGALVIDGGSLHSELGGEDVTQLRSVAVSATGHLGKFQTFIIIVRKKRNSHNDN